MEIRTTLLELALLLAIDLISLSRKSGAFAPEKRVREGQVSILRTTLTATGKIRTDLRGEAGLESPGNPQLLIPIWRLG